MWNAELTELFLPCVADLLADEKVRSMGALPQHKAGVSCLDHSILVAWYSFRICRRLGLDSRAAARGGLLHDFYLYNWQVKATHPNHLHGLWHPKAALANAKARFFLSPKEADIILKHMFPLTPRPYRYWESLVVSCMDKVCALAELAGLFPTWITRQALQPAPVCPFPDGIAAPAA
jgi:uncharacterized protein